MVKGVHHLYHEVKISILPNRSDQIKPNPNYDFARKNGINSNLTVFPNCLELLENLTIREAM